MGYNINHKGYKCLDPTTCRMYISRHVLFNENHFPFSILATHSSTVPSSLSRLSSTVLAKPPLVPSSMHSQYNKSVIHSPKISYQYTTLPQAAPTPFPFPTSSTSQSQPTVAQPSISQAVPSPSDTSSTRYFLTSVAHPSALHPAAHPSTTQSVTQCNLLLHIHLLQTLQRSFRIMKINFFLCQNHLQVLM